MGVGTVYLGLPRGFCRVGCINPVNSELYGNKTNNISLFQKLPEYDKFNIPSWAMVKDGYMFIRVYQPRINSSQLHIIKLTDSNIPIPKGAIDVGEFYEEID